MSTVAVWKQLSSDILTVSSVTAAIALTSHANDKKKQDRHWQFDVHCSPTWNVTRIAMMSHAVSHQLSSLFWRTCMHVRLSTSNCNNEDTPASHCHSCLFTGWWRRFNKREPERDETSFRYILDASRPTASRHFWMGQKREHFVLSENIKTHKLYSYPYVGVVAARWRGVEY